MKKFRPGENTLLCVSDNLLKVSGQMTGRFVRIGEDQISVVFLLRLTDLK